MFCVRVKVFSGACQRTSHASNLIAVHARNTITPMRQVPTWSRISFALKSALDTFLWPTITARTELPLLRYPADLAEVEPMQPHQYSTFIGYMKMITCTYGQAQPHIDTHHQAGCSIIAKLCRYHPSTSSGRLFTRIACMVLTAMSPNARGPCHTEQPQLGLKSRLHMALARYLPAFLIACYYASYLNQSVAD